MTPVLKMLQAVRPVFGNAVVDRVLINLPSRKPQLWEDPIGAVARRLTEFVRDGLDAGWRQKTVIAPVRGMNLNMEVVPANFFIDRFLMLYGVYEVSGTRFLQSALRPGMAVLDVGANSGYYSLIAGRLVGPEGSVHAFEPVPALRTKLERNLGLNRLRNVTVQPMAVTADSGEIEIYPSACDNNDGLASVLAGPGKTEEPLLVPAVSIDEFVAGLGGKPPDFIKIDVEGAEKLVLLGARRTLVAESPAVLFESYDVPPLAEMLREWGYEVRRLHYSLRNGVEFPTLDDEFENVFYYEGPNFVALKPLSPFGSFEKIAERSKRKVPLALKLLGTFA